MTRLPRAVVQPGTVIPCPPRARWIIGRVRMNPWRRRGAAADDSVAPPVEPAPAVQLEEHEARRLEAVFEPPRWLRDLGRASWALVGFLLLLGGIIWLLGQVSTIVEPVLVGLIVATVASPIVGRLQRRNVPRGIGAAIVLLGLLALGVLIFVLVLGGIVAEKETIGGYATDAVDRVQSWLQDLGVDSSGTSSMSANLEQAVPAILSTLATGVAKGISGLTSFAFGVSFAVFSIFFLLKDGPAFRGWVDSHLGIPRPVAQTITGNVVNSLRRYFVGVTIVAAFNAVVVGLGALILDVPLAGSIAVVTFVTAYIPFIGAFIAGTLAVVLALGSGGTTTAILMLIVVVLANGLLQNIVSPLAMGAALRLNPLVVLVATISGGALFGMIGLVLAAPLISAAMHITRDVARIRAASTPRPPVPT
jgi:putative heme transporter